MAPNPSTDTRSNTIAPIPCEVLNASGHWVGGYELMGFLDNGRLIIRSTHTHAVRELPIHRWRDPVEEAALNGRCQP